MIYEAVCAKTRKIDLKIRIKMFEIQTQNKNFCVICQLVRVIDSVIDCLIIHFNMTLNLPKLLA